MKAAAECLILLISRAEKKEREKQLKLFEFIPLITMSMTVNSGDFDDDYAFQKRISQVLEWKKLTDDLADDVVVGK